MLETVTLTPPPGPPQDKLDKFKAGHSATLHDLRVPEKNAEFRSYLSKSTFVDKRRLGNPTPNSTSWGYQRVSPPPGTSCGETKREDVFLKQLRDIVGHLLMPQKQNYEEELCVMVCRHLICTRCQLG